MHRRHDPTYYWATRRLPAEIRPATHALYGYVRTADEIVDGPRRPPSAEARRAALDAWERELEHGPRGRAAPPHPVVGALVDAGRRHGLPLGELRTYMRSMRIDCAPVRIATWPELEAYMDGSAGSVGRIMAPLLGVPERHHAGLRPPRPGVPARQLHPRRARGHGARPRLPAGRGPRSASAWPRTDLRARTRLAGAARAASRSRCGARAALFAEAEPADRRRARLRAHGHPLRRRRLPARARPRRADRLRRARPAAPACARGSCPGAALGALRR